MNECRWLPLDSVFSCWYRPCLLVVVISLIVRVALRWPFAAVVADTDSIESGWTTRLFRLTVARWTLLSICRLALIENTSAPQLFVFFSQLHSFLQAGGLNDYISCLSKAIKNEFCKISSIGSFLTSTSSSTSTSTSRSSSTSTSSSTSGSTFTSASSSSSISNQTSNQT